LKPYYVILTGSKDNAGDFLIRLRALALFKALRPDRDIVDYNNWERFTGEQLEVVNKSQALILTGGPTIRPQMWPELFPMADDLASIKVPILTIGAGWKSPSGTWDDTHHYPLSKGTMRLLKRMNDSGFLSGVRDYHTLNVMRHRGLSNFVMTGCPAYYDLDMLGREPAVPGSIDRISFSLGVSYVVSKAMKDVMQITILSLQERFRNGDFQVVFHHSTDPRFYKDMGTAKQRFAREQSKFIEWLDSKEVKYTAVSGSADHLINHYADCDLHVGFRVHAHLFMCSISRPTVLISEDGRGKGVRGTIGGIVFDGFDRLKPPGSLRERVVNKFIARVDPYVPNTHLAEDLVSNIAYEQQNGYPRIVRHIRRAVDENFKSMKAHLEQLP